jgi:hypothetical protein
MLRFLYPALGAALLAAAAFATHVHLTVPTVSGTVAPDGTMVVTERTPLQTVQTTYYPDGVRATVVGR